jgi:hypothetical protein
MSAEKPNESITLRTGSMYEITAEDQGYFIQLLQSTKDGDGNDLILLTREQIDRLYDFVHRHDVDAGVISHTPLLLTKEATQ